MQETNRNSGSIQNEMETESNSACLRTQENASDRI